MLDSTEKLSFSEFPPVSIEEWEKAISKDLKGADYKEKLNWNTREGIEVLPFYRKEDLNDVSHTVVPFRKERSWQTLELINDSNVEKALKHIHTASDASVDGFVLNSNSDELYSEQNLSSLLKAMRQDVSTIIFGKAALSRERIPIIAAAIPSSGIPADAFVLNLDPYSSALLNGKLADKPEFVELIKTLPSSTRCLAVNADVFGDTGSRITEQIAYALAIGNEYLGMADDLGISPADVASRITFNFSAGSDYFPELAKFRAFRLVWNKVLETYEEGLSAKAPAFIHSKTSFWNKTVYDAHNNLLRATTEAMSATLGGADALTVHPFDEITNENSDFSARMARNIQHLLREESYLDRVEDPGAGSYYIEVLTDKITTESWKLFQEIESKGGYEACLKEGFIQAQIRNAQDEKLKMVATRRTTIVGVNNYPAPAKKGINPGSGNPLVSAFEPSVYDEVEPIETTRSAAEFEQLRHQVESRESVPYIQLIPFGDLRMRKARALFSLNFLGGAGFKVEDHNGFTDLNAATEFIQKNAPDVVVLCSSDPEYADWVPSFCEVMEKQDKRPYIILAGYPKDDIETFTKAGVDEFIHIRCNTLETLKSINAKLEAAK